MKRYREYKDSGIEWIGKFPDKWIINKFSRVAFYQEGPGLRNWQFTETGIKVICVTNITENGINFEVYKKFISIDEYIKSYKHFTVKKGDLLLASSGASWGKIAIFDLNENVILNTSTIRLNSNKLESVKKGLIRWLLYSDLVQEQLKILLTGSCQPNFGPTHLSKLLICYPNNVPEQEKIASFLDHKTAIIDSLVAKKEKQIELLKEQRTALINHAVTKGLNPKATMKDSGIEWLGEIPEHWEVMAMKHIASLKSGDSITSEAITKDGAYPVFGGNGIRGYYSSFTHDGDFVLIGRQGALCGNINYAWGKFWASEHAVVATMKLDNSVFWFGELLKSMNLNQYSQAAAQPGLAVETIKNLRIPVPSLSEQKEIHLFIKNENKRILDATQKAQKQIAFLKEYRTALISEAVTGKIDVRDWEPTGEKKNFSQRSQSTQRKRG